MTNQTPVSRLLVPLATLLTIAANVGIEAVQLNGVTSAQISDRYDNQFVPAGYVFAIWGLIYLALIVYSIYQTLPAQSSNPRLQAITPVYLIASVANVSWLVLFHYFQFGLALIAMLVLFVSLLACYLHLGIGTSSPPAAERWFVHVPFSIYLGWVSVAMIANATQLLVFVGWTGLGLAPETWSILMITVATAVGAIMLMTRRDIAFALVLVWAFSGIGNKLTTAPAVVLAAWVAVGIVVLVAVMSYFRRLPSAEAKSRVA